MKKIRLVLVTLAAAAGVAACDPNIEPQAPNGEVKYMAMLSGLSARPATTGYGVFEGKLGADGNSMTYTLKVGRLVNLTAAHIHNAPFNASGGIVVDLYLGPTIAQVGDSLVLASGTLTPSSIRAGGPSWANLIAGMESGTMYVNVHTTANPGGEIRGQLAKVRGIQ